MRKNVFKKIMAATLATTMVFSMAACGQEQSSTEANVSESSVVGTSESEVASTVDEEETGVTFPLKEEMTFDIMITYDGDPNAWVEDNAFMQRLYEETNVKINFVALPSDSAMNNLNALFTAKQEGDAVMRNVVSEADLAAMAANGLFIPLDEYINDPEIMPNFNERVLAESPQTKGFITTTDGNIYALPRYVALEGSYLEGPMWINKEWLAKVGKEVPTTIKELEEVMIAFRDNDCNGNGKDDEIPLLFRSGDSSAHMEALLGMWGLATKDSGNDHYVDIEDGKVVYVPTTDAYKDAIKTLNSWYEQKLLWSEGFTADSETFSAKWSGDNGTPVYGIICYKEPSAAFVDQYVQIPPISADGYEAEFFRHPGGLGVKGLFSVTRSCENPEVLMAWIDKFYSFENTIEILYGTEGQFWQYNKEGKVEFLSKDDEELRLQVFGKVVTPIPNALTAADYNERIALSGTDASLQENYAVYKDVMATEYWPRPYMTSENSARVKELRTDISSTVAMNKANWVTGVTDIDAEWDAYVKSLEKMGLEEYMSILQETYDVFLEGMK